jgi:hypothetical protein
MSCCSSHNVSIVLHSPPIQIPSTMWSGSSTFSHPSHRHVQTKGFLVTSITNGKGLVRVLRLAIKRRTTQSALSHILFIQVDFWRYGTVAKGTTLTSRITSAAGSMSCSMRVLPSMTKYHDISIVASWARKVRMFDFVRIESKKLTHHHSQRLTCV